MSTVLIRCTSQAPWVCEVQCRGCGHVETVAGRWAAQNHTRAVAIGRAHAACRKD